jgi:hypothetical protein
LPHEKSNPKETMPHFEKVTQIKTDYPRLSAPGGQNGVNHEREKAVARQVYSLSRTCALMDE